MEEKAKGMKKEMSLGSFQRALTPEDTPKAVTLRSTSEPARKNDARLGRCRRIFGDAEGECVGDPMGGDEDGMKSEEVSDVESAEVERSDELAMSLRVGMW